MEIEAA